MTILRINGHEMGLNCDVCGGAITDVDSAMIRWRWSPNEHDGHIAPHDFKLLHKRCESYDPKLPWHELRAFITPYGLDRLLGLIELPDADVSGIVRIIRLLYCCDGLPGEYQEFLPAEWAIRKAIVVPTRRTRR